MYLCLAILGPTGSGKSDFAVEVAHKLNGEIVCLDSTTIYKGFDIGSSKPDEKARALVPHHLLDISAPTEPFSAHHFVELADEVISEIHSRKKLPIIVGGTYFYCGPCSTGCTAFRTFRKNSSKQSKTSLRKKKLSTPNACMRS